MDYTPVKTVEWRDHHSTPPGPIPALEPQLRCVSSAADPQQNTPRALPPIPSAPGPEATTEATAATIPGQVFEPIPQHPPQTETNEPIEPQPAINAQELPHTRIIVVNGAARTVCNGPICRSLNKDPPRHCSTCSYQYCKKCCIKYQRDNQKRCRQATHAEAAVNHREPSPSGGPGRALGYNPEKPLRAEHYEAMTRKTVEWNQYANHLTQKKAADEALRKSVEIYYWNSVCSVISVELKDMPIKDWYYRMVRPTRSIGLYAQPTQFSPWRNVLSPFALPSTSHLRH